MVGEVDDSGKRLKMYVGVDGEFAPLTVAEVGNHAFHEGQ